MKTIQKFLQAFLLILGIFLIAQAGQAQCNVRALVKDASCFSNNGQINLQVTGTPPYKYEWSNGQKTSQLSHAMAGRYTVTVTDAKGGKASTTAVVQNASSLEVNLTSTGSNIYTTVTGGQEPYRFTANNISNSSKQETYTTGNGTFAVRSGGEYVVVVTDAKGCSIAKSIVVNK